MQAPITHQYPKFIGGLAKPLLNLEYVLGTI